VTDLDGRPLDFSAGPTLKRNRGVVVSNGLIHDRVLEIVKGVIR
jgi:3'(2'), 5'-bisphosphate nucleotidase